MVLKSIELKPDLGDPLRTTPSMELELVRFDPEKPPVTSATCFTKMMPDPVPAPCSRTYNWASEWAGEWSIR